MIDSISELQQNLLKNLLTQCHLQQTGKTQVGNRTCWKWQSRDQDSSLHLYPGPPFLPRREWAQEDLTVWPQAIQQNKKQSMFINIEPWTQESRQQPTLQDLLPTRVCVPYRTALEHGPHTGPVVPCRFVESISVYGKHWIAGTIPIAPFLQRCSNMGGRERQGCAITRKAR